MGCVYQAERLPTQKSVALKLLQPEFANSDHAIRRFERETEVASRLDHPNIVKVLDSGQLSGQLFLAMEMLEGISLADVIAHGDQPRRGALGGALHIFTRRHRDVNGRLSVTRSIAIMRQILAALKHAHSAGIVHRDLKPENIMLVQGSGLLARERVKLLDFGIAKLTEPPEGQNQKLTQLGVAVGTPRYMSPEQALGQDADARSDLYACGVLLYEMLTGHVPFEAETNLEILSMHMTATPKSLRSVAPDAQIPAAVEKVVLRALAKKPLERFQSADDFRKALARAVHTRDEAEPISGLEPTILEGAKVQHKARGRRGHAALRWLVVSAAAALIADHHFASQMTHTTRAAAVSRESSATASNSQREAGVTRQTPAAARAPPKTVRASAGATRTVSKRAKPRSH